MRVDIGKREAVFIVAVAVLILVDLGVTAFGTSDPNILGHSAEEIDLSGGVNGDARFNNNLILENVVFDNDEMIITSEGSPTPGSVGSIELRKGNTGNYLFSVGLRKTGTGGPSNRLTFIHKDAPQRYASFNSPVQLPTIVSTHFTCNIENQGSLAYFLIAKVCYCNGIDWIKASDDVTICVN